MQREQQLTLSMQAIRNYSDLQSLAVPDKYRRLGGFHKSAAPASSCKTARLIVLVSDIILARQPHHC